MAAFEKFQNFERFGTEIEAAFFIFFNGMGSWILFSGGFGTGPHCGANLHGWTAPEADIFADLALKAGIPVEKILIEIYMKKLPIILDLNATKNGKIIPFY